MITLNQRECIGCAACLNVCNDDAIYLIDNKAYINSANCTLCGRCIEVCPVGAIQLKNSTIELPTPKIYRQPTTVKMEPAEKPSIPSMMNNVLPQIVTKIGELIKTVIVTRSNPSTVRGWHPSTAGSGRHRRRRHRGRR